MAIILNLLLLFRRRAFSFLLLCIDKTKSLFLFLTFARDLAKLILAYIEKNEYKREQEKNLKKIHLAILLQNCYK